MCWQIQSTITKLVLCHNVHFKVLVSAKCRKNAKSINGKKSMKKSTKLIYVFCGFFISHILHENIKVPKILRIQYLVNSLYVEKPVLQNNNLVYSNCWLQTGLEAHFSRKKLFNISETRLFSIPQQIRTKICCP